MVKNKSKKADVIDLPDRRLMESMMSNLAGSRKATAVDQAQKIMYDAWEHDDPLERIELAEQALKVCNDCADAWMLLAEESAENLDERFTYCQKAMAAGERSLGEETFTEAKGHFWGLLETRPYMRARLGLAQCLWMKGEHDAAITHFQAMLELNPTDNQGVRDLLLVCLLEDKRHSEAEVLLHAYEEDISATWAFSRALLAFRREGDSVDSRQFRKAAINCNKHVLGYLTGQRKLPNYPPEFIGIGDKNEAVAYVFDNRQAWLATPGAIPWLRKGKK